MHVMIELVSLGWAPDELDGTPAPIPGDIPSRWIHTGTQWVALPEPVYAVWFEARKHPVAVTRMTQAIARVFADVGLARKTWWQQHVWAAWPLIMEPYGGAQEMDQITLVTHGTPPGPNISDTVWHSHPSLLALQQHYQQRTQASDTQGRAWVGEAVPIILAMGRGHLIYGRQTVVR